MLTLNASHLDLEQHAPGLYQHCAHQNIRLNLFFHFGFGIGPEFDYAIHIWISVESL